MASIYIKQFDVTQDVAGMVFAENPIKYVNVLALTLGMETSAKYKSMSSCFQMVKVREGMKKSSSENAFLQRVKVFNKFPCTCSRRPPCTSGSAWV